MPIPGTSHRHRLEENAAAVSRFETIDQKAATGSWHWFFLIQGRGLPEPREMTLVREAAKRRDPR